MPLILLDANIPTGLRAALQDHTAQTSFQMGWSTLRNGDLMTAAERAGFTALITGDQNILYQQNLTGWTLALLVLDNVRWPVVKANLQFLRDALKLLAPGAYIPVAFRLPPLKRRAFVLPDTSPGNKRSSGNVTSGHAPLMVTMFTRASGRRSEFAALALRFMWRSGHVVTAILAQPSQ